MFPSSPSNRKDNEMNSNQKRVCKTKYKENCYVLVSAAKRDMKETLGDFRVKSNVSFLYDAGDVATEWEMEYGPIQIWNRCDEDDEGASEHYFYDYHNSPPLNWSQLAVDRCELPKAANSGDWDYIFEVLKDWTEGR